MSDRETDRIKALFGKDWEKFLLDLGTLPNDPYQAALGTEEAGVTPPETQEIPVRVEEITELAQTTGEKEKAFRMFKLEILTSDFKLYVDDSYVELGFEGGQGLDFSEQTFAKIVFEDLPGPTNTKHLVDTWEDKLGHVNLRVKQKNEPTSKVFSLSSNEGRNGYQLLMQDPSRISWMRYDVSDHDFGHLYSFGMDYKSNNLRSGRMFLGLPKASNWTDPIVSWVAVHHRDNPLLKDLAIVPPLRGAINRERLNSAF